MGPFDRNGELRHITEWPCGPETQLNILSYHAIASHDDSDFRIELAKLGKGMV